MDREILFHVMDGGSNLWGWEMAPAAIPTLVSLAHYEDRKNSLQTERGLRILRTKCHPLILDSGRLTWMRKGLQDKARMDLTPRLLEVGPLIGAMVVVAGDVPMEPKFLNRVGLSKEEALEITWSANERLHASHGSFIKGYVIQGFEEEDYLQSIKIALASNQSKDVAAGKAVWVIGSTCLAHPDKVAVVAALVRSKLPGKIHVLGQGRPSLIARLRRLGIAWADSGTAAGYACRAKWLYPLGNGEFAWKRLHDGRTLSPDAYGLLLRNNVEVLELCLQATRVNLAR